MQKGERRHSQRRTWTSTLAVRVVHTGRLLMSATMAATPVIFVPFHSITEVSRNTSSSRSRFVCTLVW